MEGSLSTHVLYWGDGNDVPAPVEPPLDPENFCYRLTGFVGVGKGTDSFQIMVCSPTWFAEQAKTHWERLWGGHEAFSGVRENMESHLVHAQVG